MHQSIRLRRNAGRTRTVTGLYDLPAIHQDPFDRALMAQAIVEDLILITNDATIVRYASERFRVVQ